MAFNMVVFVCVIVVLTRHVRSTATQQKFKAKKFIRLMFSIGGVMALFGLTWLFATLTISVSGLRETFQILFTIFNSFQGFFIFLFFCVLNKEARDSWKEIFSSNSESKKKLDSSPTSPAGKHTDLSSTHHSKTVPKPLNLVPITSNNHDNDKAASPLSPFASKPGKVLGLDDVPETSTFHITPSKTTFIT